MSQLETPSESVSNYPFAPVEGNLFTPVCLKTHWDPTEMLRHIIPQQHVELPQSFRPWTKICKNYVTSAPAIPAPMPPKNMVFPPGGEFYPPGRYSANIDVESRLKTLNYPLDKWCPSTKYIPSQTSNMYVAGSTVPDRKPVSDAFVDELAMPQALLRTDIYTCRSENDTKNFERSGRLFNNPTKQDRYGAAKFYALPGGGRRGEPMPHGGVNVVPLTNDARIAAFPIQQPGGALPSATSKTTNNSRPIKGFGSTYSPRREPSNSGINPSDRDYTSFVGVTTSGLAAPVW